MYERMSYYTHDVTEIDAGHKTPEAATASGVFMPFFK
jgi:hypothetical protein